jgi:hypothetical protein
MLTNRRRALLGIATGGALLTLPGADACAQSKDPLPRTRDYIVALVRSHAAADAKARPVQKIEPLILKPEPQSAPDNALVFDHFVGDLHLRYVFDDPQFMLAVRVRDLKRLGVDRAELPAIVVENYRKLYPKLAVVSPVQGLGLVTQGGELEPCIMLDGTFWQRQMKAFGGELIAAVPSAQEVYFAPREPKENVALLKKLATLHYEKAGKRAVSRTVFGWRNFRWEVVA